LHVSNDKLELLLLLLLLLLVILILQHMLINDLRFLLFILYVQGGAETVRRLIT